MRSFDLRIRTECSEHVNSSIDAYWAYVLYVNVRKTHHWKTAFNRINPNLNLILIRRLTWVLVELTLPWSDVVVFFLCVGCLRESYLSFSSRWPVWVVSASPVQAGPTSGRSHMCRRYTSDLGPIQCFELLATIGGNFALLSRGMIDKQFSPRHW